MIYSYFLKSMYNMVSTQKENTHEHLSFPKQHILNMGKLLHWTIFVHKNAKTT